MRMETGLSHMYDRSNLYMGARRSSGKEDTVESNEKG